MAKIDVAILGATGTVGQRFIQRLQNHPRFRVAEVAASERSVGRCYGDAVHWVLPDSPTAEVASMTVLPLDHAFKSPVVMSALPGDVATLLEPALAARGHLVSSNTSANRMVADVPILLPDLNADHVGLIAAQRQGRGWAGSLVTMSNCTSVPVVVALAPLLKFGVEKVHVVSMQAISGSGYPGVASFDILDNVVPYIGGEEEKLQTEPLKILGQLAGNHIDPTQISISATCNRVPVLDGHTVCVSVSFAENPSAEDILEAWANFRGHEWARHLPSAPSPIIQYREALNRPQPRLDREVGDGMTTVIGRLRPCNLLGWKFTALSHNTIRGAAGGAIFNAELVAEHFSVN
jgi:aspartate-semialdehyde dehydrogenase